MSGPSKREAATAYHEAGHAVVGLWEGVPTSLLSVSIVPDREAQTLGHTVRGMYPRVPDIKVGEDGKPHRFYREFNPEFDDRQLVGRRLRPEIVKLFAGPLAEKRFTGRHSWVGAKRDRQAATDLIDHIVGSERQAQKYLAFLWAVAEDAVALHWLEIDALAQELLARKTMTGREIRAFLQAGTAAERRSLGD